jgi:hypothetical protein
VFARRLQVGFLITPNAACTPAPPRYITPMPDPLPIQRPTSSDELAALIRQASAAGTQIHVTGSDSLPLTTFDPPAPSKPSPPSA